MAPKPRTVARPPSAPLASRTVTGSTPSTTRTRRRRYVYAPASLVLLLLLHAFSHLICFILLTEPCLNPSYTSRLADKLGYFSLLTTRTAIPPGEWEQRFTAAGVRGLFGVGVIQAWFTARLNAYVQRAEREHGRLVAALRRQRGRGEKVGVDTRFAEQQEEDGEGVGSFIRQLESVSLTFLATPLMVAAIYAMLVLMGAEVGKWKQTAVVAIHLTLLVVLPLIHIIGLPDLDPTTPTTPSTTTPPLSSTPSTSPTSSTSPSHWTRLLTLRPQHSFLLPLYHPPIFCLLATLASTATLALDWNVSYQTYPFPLLVGSLLGLAAGDLYTIGLILFG